MRNWGQENHKMRVKNSASLIAKPEVCHKPDKYIYTTSWLLHSIWNHTLAGYAVVTTLYTTHCLSLQTSLAHVRVTQMNIILSKMNGTLGHFCAHAGWTGMVRCITWHSKIYVSPCGLDVTLDGGLFLADWFSNAKGKALPMTMCVK